MFMKISNMMFLFFLISSTLMCISSSNWILIWLSLEINLMSLIPLLMYKIKFNNSSSSIKYFLAQAMASILLLMGLLILYKSSSNHNLISSMNLINISLAIKLGIPPFQVWIPQVIEMINMFKIILLLIWQKIAPMILMSYSITYFVMLMIMLSPLVGAFGGINQNNLKKIFFYSSLVHLGWMMTALMLNEKMWMMYMIVYSMTLVPLILLCQNLKVSSISQVNTTSFTLTHMVFFMMMLMVLAGLPPFSNFLIKILVIKLLMINTWSFPLNPILILASLLTIFYYFKITWSTLLIMKSKNKSIFLYPPMKKNLLFLLMFSLNMTSPYLVLLA